MVNAYTNFYGQYLPGYIPKGAQVVTPNDSTDLPGGVCAGLRCSAAGTVKVTWVSGETTSMPVVAGDNCGQIKRVWSTGTDSMVIVALY